MALEVADQPAETPAAVRRVVETPLGSSARGAGNAPHSFKVSKMVAGSLQYLGVVGPRATPETIISSFPLTLPLPGQTAEFFLQGLTALSEETGRPLTLTLTGDSPEVIAARSRVVSSSPATPGAAGTIALESELLKATRALLDQERAAIKAREDRLVLEERTLADKAGRAAAEHLAQTQNFWSAQMALQEQRFKQQTDEERNRREQDRKDFEEKRKAEKVEQDRRDRLDSEERDRREKREKDERSAEREKDREYHTRMATIASNSSIETLIPKVTGVLTALGIKPGEIVAKILNPTGDGSAISGETIVGAVATLVGKLSDNVADVVRLRMEIEAKRDGIALPRQIVQQRMTLPAADKAEAKQNQESSRAERNQATPATIQNTALEKLPRPLIRDARVALRELATTLRGKPEAEWEIEIAAFFLSKGEKVKPYIEAVGLKTAAIEAGATADEATRIEARITALQKKAG